MLYTLNLENNFKYHAIEEQRLFLRSYKFSVFMFFIFLFFIFFKNLSSWIKISDAPFKFTETALNTSIDLKYGLANGLQYDGYRLK